MISRQKLDETARLAALSFEDDQLDRIGREMAAILSLVDEIPVLDEADDAMFQAVGTQRDDAVRPSYERDEILQNAADTQDGFFTCQNGKARL